MNRSLCPFRWAIIWTVAATLGASSSVAQAQATAEYRVTFDSTWSSATHPIQFPPNAHFSNLIGSLHAAGAGFWAPGDISTPGMESMAETGSVSPLNSEIQSSITSGDSTDLLIGPIIFSPGSTFIEFTASETHPLLSLVTMIAPSPDWFLGIDSVPLNAGGTWIHQTTIDLYAYDAGTDSGATYIAANLDTNPPDPIFMITTAPFATGTPPLGTFTIERLDAPPQFIRADVNEDGLVDLGDAVRALDGLFLSNPIGCQSAGDINDDGLFDISDPIALLNNLFGAGPALPGPSMCGPDTTPDALACDAFAGCP